MLVNNDSNWTNHEVFGNAYTRPALVIAIMLMIHYWDYGILLIARWHYLTAIPV